MGPEQLLKNVISRPFAVETDKNRQISHTGAPASLELKIPATSGLFQGNPEKA